MTAEKLKHGEIVYLRHQLKMASKRLAMIHFCIGRDGHDPKLAAEAEGLVTQIASLEVELKMLKGAAA